MTSRSILVTIRFLLAASVCAQFPPQPDLTEVHGVVTEFGTGETVQRISVSLTPVSSEPQSAELSFEEFIRARITRRSTNSDDDGRFVLEDIDPGDYYLQAERNGYFRPGEIDPRGTLISVPEDTILPLDLELIFGAVIEGHVFDDAGEPLRGVQVVAQKWVYGLDGPVLEDVVLPTPAGFRRSGNSSDVSVTNRQGAYRLAGLLPGEYQVVARRATPIGESGEGADPEVGGPVYYPSTDRAACVQQSSSPEADIWSLMAAHS
jgi:hypothetical protein